MLASSRQKWAHRGAITKRTNSMIVVTNIPSPSLYLLTCILISGHLDVSCLICKFAYRKSYIFCCYSFSIFSLLSFFMFAIAVISSSVFCVLSALDQSISSSSPWYSLESPPVVVSAGNLIYFLSHSSVVGSRSKPYWHGINTHSPFSLCQVCLMSAQ